MTARTVSAVALAAALALVSRSPAADHGTLAEVLAGESQTFALSVASGEGGKAALLKGKDDYTLFAPTDAALRKLGDKAIGRIANDPSTITKLFDAHLVRGTYTAADLKKKAKAGDSLTTLSGAKLKIEDRKDGLYVGGVKVAKPDLMCSNGVIHVLETALPVAKE